MGAQKIVSSDTILAILPPALAVGWVIADAATGFVSADRAFQTIPPVVQIVRDRETASVATAEPTANRGAIVVCTRYNSIAADSFQLNENLLRLCRAGLKFTISLPKI